jgi:hypothetical protein
MTTTTMPMMVKAFMIVFQRRPRKLSAARTTTITPMI